MSKGLGKVAVNSLNSTAQCPRIFVQLQVDDMRPRAHYVLNPIAILRAQSDVSAPNHRSDTVWNLAEDKQLVSWWCNTIKLLQFLSISEDATIWHLWDLHRNTCIIFDVCHCVVLLVICYLWYFMFWWYLFVYLIHFGSMCECLPTILLLFVKGHALFQGWCRGAVRCFSYFPSGPPRSNLETKFLYDDMIFLSR